MRRCVTIIAAATISCSATAFQFSARTVVDRLGKPHNYLFMHQVPSRWNENNDRKSLLSLNAHSTDVYVAGFSEYMVKAHEEKLRAINDFEKNKREEFRALKEEVAELRSLLADTTRKTVQREMASKHFISDYMVKAHKEKLRAINEIERIKHDEIRLLQQQISELRSLVGVTTQQKILSVNANEKLSNGSSAISFSTMSKDELIMIAEQYKSFIGKYVVDSSIEKNKAVKAAEEALKRKLEERVRVTKEVPSSEVAKSKSSPLGASEVAANNLDSLSRKSALLYNRRNTAVLAAGNAHKSRWGEMELNKIRQIQSSLLDLQREVTDSTALSTGEDKISPQNLSLEKQSVVSEREPSLYRLRNKAVRAAAIAGKSRWGPMELNRIDKLSMAPDTKMSVATSLSTKDKKYLFKMRNKIVAAAGAVGKSRWGEREVEKATSLISKFPETSISWSHSQSLPLSLNDLRNSAVIKAAAVGKSRWGEMEVSRINGINVLQRDLVVNGGLGRMP